MAFSGWLSYAGNELLNAERTRAYVKNALPTLRMPTRCIDEVDLAGILDDPAYRSPMIDDAPWVDHDDPDTYGFLGALPLSVSGLTDSTRTATVVQNTGDGGATTGKRRGTKEVRVTALLIGESPASIEAGKRWLTAALDGGCDPCAPNDLCFLVGTNTTGGPSMGDYDVSTIPPNKLDGQVAYYHHGTGVFKPTLPTQTVDSRPTPYPLPCDEVLWHWRISGATANTGIILETLGESGVTNSATYLVAAAGGTFTISDRGISAKKSWSRLRITSAPGEQVTIAGVDMEYRTDPLEDACFTNYARQLRQVDCIAGPVTIQEFEPTAGAMETVEFSFTAAPYVYGLPQQVLSVAGPTIQKNVRTADAFELSKAVPICTVPKRPKLIVDPDCPPVPVAPRANVAVASCKPPPDWRSSYALSIPDTLIPLWSEAVPILSLTTGSQAARSAQIRFMPRPLPTQAPVDLDPCSVCGEFTIDYIPANSKFTLDGVEQRAYITQRGGKVTDAGHLLSGMTSDTLFSWPVLTCGTGYLALVDITTEGVEKFDLSIAVRE
jgi:hypothetical protein